MKTNELDMIKILMTRSLKANKKRNFLMMSAIVLTTFMITTVLSVAMSMAESVQLQAIRLQGSKSHALFGFPTEEQLNKLQSLDYIESYGTGKYIGFLEETLLASDAQLSLIHVDQTFFDDILTPAIDGITGSLPVEPNEIMASRWVLEMIGIDEPEVGMSIPLSFVLMDEETVHDEVFILSGFYTSFDHLFRQDGYVIATSEFAHRFGSTVLEHGSVNILFQDNHRVQEDAERLRVDLGLTSEELIIHPVFNISDADHWVMMGSVVLMILFLMVTGYLLIYNVLYISITRDVRFYGLLKTIGVTSRQIRQMIIGQALKLCLISLPIGLGLGFLISFVLIPWIVRDIQTGVVVSFSPLIYMGAVIFALLTTLLGAAAPARKMSRMSSIEAIKYVGEVTTQSYGEAQTNGKLHQMAFRNVFRDRMRAIVVFLSLSFSVIIFISMTLIVFSLNLDQYVSQVENGFVLENDRFLTQADVESAPFDDYFLSQINGFFGLEAVYTTSQQPISIDYQEALSAHIELDMAWHQERDLFYLSKTELIEEGLSGILFGIDGEVLRELNPDLDLIAFERGDFAIIPTDQPEMYSDVKDIEGRVPAGASFSLPLGGFVPMDSNRWRTPYAYSAPLLIVSNTLLEQLAYDPKVTHVYMDTQEGYDGYFLEFLQEMISNHSAITMRSRIEEQQVFEEARNILLILGIGVSSILGGIGLMNFMNTMSMGILMRKREFAILESVGMTRKQLRFILVCEGLWYGIITLLLVATIGNGVAIGLYWLVAQPWGDFMTFVYPVVPTLIISFIVLMICAFVPEIFYRSLNKQSVIERLREVE